MWEEGPKSPSSSPIRDPPEGVEFQADLAVAEEVDLEPPTDPIPTLVAVVVAGPLEADMGADLPWGRKPKSLARIPKSSIPVWGGFQIWGGIGEERASGVVELGYLGGSDLSC